MCKCKAFLPNPRAGCCPFVCRFEQISLYVSPFVSWKSNIPRCIVNLFFWSRFWYRDVTPKDYAINCFSVHSKPKWVSRPATTKLIVSKPIALELLTPPPSSAIAKLQRSWLIDLSHQYSMKMSAGNWRSTLHPMTSTSFPDRSAQRLYTRLRHATASKPQAVAVAVDSCPSCRAP